MDYWTLYNNEMAHMPRYTFHSLVSRIIKLSDNMSECGGTCVAVSQKKTEHFKNKCWAYFINLFNY